MKPTDIKLHQRSRILEVTFEDESHFTLNLAGFVVAVLLVAYAVYRFRDHPFMDEVVYVWNLKKQQSL